MKKKNILLKILLSIFVVLLLGVVVLFVYLNKLNEETYPYYLASLTPEVTLYGDDTSITLTRGTLLNIKKNTKEIDNVEYKQFEIDDVTYYVLDDNLELNRDDCVKEVKMFVLRSAILTNEPKGIKISGEVNKGEEVNITGFNALKEDGRVDYYQINNKGYINSKYLSLEYYETALDSSIYSDCFYNSGGDPTLIEYYNKEEINFDNNKTPDVVKALYINAEGVKNADEYIKIAKNTKGINAFVVDIKDCYVDTQLAYDSNVAKEYAPSTSNIVNTYDEYKENVKKIKDAGYYLIGRITSFKDDAFANDNVDDALLYNNELYSYGYVKWPSVYSRKMWEYDVALALEAVNNFGFNEIQFDYCRLPENVEGVDLRNNYDESRIEAISKFLRYATEKLHENNTYISVDVFGEISGSDQNSFSAFVTSYGQFWPMMSNIVDVISSMPYPDHFSNYSYGVNEPWLNVYDLMYNWGQATYKAQENTYDKAKCRTWIMAQGSEPYDIDYTKEFVYEQIEGLKDANVFDGYMTWNAASNIYKYNSYVEVLD